jgi:hypothetical protein
MQADTVRRWSRQGLRHHGWWRRGRQRPGRPPIPAETRHFIREMSRDNGLWGALRLHGEFAKLGITVSRITVAKSMIRCPNPLLPPWRPCIRNQTPELRRPEALTDVVQSLRVLCLCPESRLRHWLDRFVSGERQRDVRPHPGIFLPVRRAMSRPVLWTPDTQDHGGTSARSPPVAGWSSPAALVVETFPERVRAAVRFAPSA